MLDNSWFKKERPLLGLFGSGGGIAAAASGGSPFEATGGTKITDGDYTYHVFVTDTPGAEKSLVITEGTRDGEILVVAGGGSAGYDNGGGAGAGGVAHAPVIPLESGTHAVVVGATKNGAATRGANYPHTGNDSTYAHPLGTITAKGGGGPGANPPTGYDIPGPQGATQGGSGTGARRTNPGSDPSYYSGPSSATQPTQNPGYPVTVNNYGNAGGDAGSGAANWWFAGGGGGAGGAGTPMTGGRSGGDGQPFPSFPAPVLEPGIPAPERPGWTPAVGPTGLFAGGGGGSSESPPASSTASPGGGGAGNAPLSDTHGTYGTGGGGGSGGSEGGNGGSGIVIVRYLT